MDEGQRQALALVLARLDQRDRAEIETIDRALARIAAGSYGTSAGCGHSIPTSRLEALPAAGLLATGARYRAQVEIASLRPPNPIAGG